MEVGFRILQSADSAPAGKKAFSPKKGLVFAVNGASAPPPPPPTPRPPPLFSWGAVGVLLKIPGGGGSSRRGGGGGEGPGVCTGNLGGGGRGRRGPIYRENEPLFRRKRLKDRLQAEILDATGQWDEAWFICHPCPTSGRKNSSVDVSDIFYFFWSGESKVPGVGGGEGFLLKIPTGGGVSRAGGGGSSGREGVCGEFLGGGG